MCHEPCFENPIASKLSANAYDDNALVWEYKGKANNNVELTVAFE